MVHAIELADGLAIRYRNRYVRTPLYEHPGESRMALARDPQSERGADAGTNRPVTVAITRLVLNVADPAASRRPSRVGVATTSTQSPATAEPRMSYDRFTVTSRVGGSLSTARE